MTNHTTNYTQKTFSLLIIILISLFSILLYLNTTYDKFVFDDFKIIVENFFVKEWKYFPKIFTKDYFVVSGEMTYRPFVTITYFIDYAIWHSKPLGFHITNIIFHTLNNVLFYLFINITLKNKQIVFLSTLFFATHPILVETVNAIGYREDLLSATFLLISFIYFIKSDNLLYDNISYQKKRFITYYAVSLTAYFLAVFSKEMAVTLPVLLPLFVVFSNKKEVWKNILCRLRGIYIGYIVITLFYLIIRFVVLRNPAILKVNYQHGGFCTNVFTMFKVLASYVKLSFFPYNLNADYVVPFIKTPLDGSFISSIILLTTVFIILAFFCKHRNIFAFWTAWFFITLLPVMNIIPIGNIMAERYLYIPAMGFCVVKGILISRITDPTISPRALKLRRVVQLTLILITTGVYSVNIIKNNGDWRDELTLWAKTIKRSPESYRGHCNLGIVYMESGFLERAQAEYQTAIRLNPRVADIHNNLGIVYTKKGMEDNALIEYEEAVKLNNDYAAPHNNLGNIYFNRGNIDRAKKEYEEALRSKPDYTLAHNGLGSVYNATGDLNRAGEEFKKALFYDSNYIPARNNLGTNYARRGMLNEAIAEFKKCIELDNTQKNSHYNLGLAYENTGKINDAIREYATVIQLDPKYLNARHALGTLYRGLGLYDKAIEEFTKIIELSPNNVNARRILVFLYAEGKKDTEMAKYYLKELLRIDPSQAQKEDIKRIRQNLKL